MYSSTLWVRYRYDRRTAYAARIAVVIAPTKLFSMRNIFSISLSGAAISLGHHIKRINRLKLVSIPHHSDGTTLTNSRLMGAEKR